MLEFAARSLDAPEPAHSMRALFDNVVPRGIASALKGHTIEEVRDGGWDRLKGSDLLDAAEAEGFDVFVTTDRNISCQQNLQRSIAIVGLTKGPQGCNAISREIQYGYWNLDGE